MAKELAGSFTSAVTGAVADKAVSKIIDSLSRQQTPVADKLQRLERLCLRVRSTVEVSEQHDIESASLLQWRDDLKRAVALGDEVLLAFRRQPMPTTATVDTDTALSFTRKALSSMARRIGGAATALFASNEDAKKLDGAVEALEKAAENLGEFIGLLQLEASPRLKRRRRAAGLLGFACKLAKGNVDVSPDADGTRTESCENSRGDWELEEEVAVLVGRLREALGKISIAVDTAEIRNVRLMGLEWLEQWVVFLREAMQRGRDVLHAVRSQVGKETSEYGRDEDELRSFVHTIESIAGGDLEVFNRLVTSF